MSLLRDAPIPHPTRTRILEHLRLLPGDHLRSIARTLQVSLGEVRYHLHVLHRHRQIREDKVAHRARFYVSASGSQAERNELFQKHWQHRELRSRILRAVQTRGSVRPTQVAKSVGVSRQLATYHLTSLSASGHLARDGPLYRIPGGNPGVSPQHATPEFGPEFRP